MREFLGAGKISLPRLDEIKNRQYYSNYFKDILGLVTHLINNLLFYKNMLIIYYLKQLACLISSKKCNKKMN